MSKVFLCVCFSIRCRFWKKQKNSFSILLLYIFDKSLAPIVTVAMEKRVVGRV